MPATADQIYQVPASISAEKPIGVNPSGASAHKPLSIDDTEIQFRRKGVITENVALYFRISVDNLLVCMLVLYSSWEVTQREMRRINHRGLLAEVAQRWHINCGVLCNKTSLPLVEAATIIVYLGASDMPLRAVSLRNIFRVMSIRKPVTMKIDRCVSFSFKISFVKTSEMVDNDLRPENFSGEKAATGNLMQVGIMQGTKEKRKKEDQSKGGVKTGHCGEGEK